MTEAAAVQAMAWLVTLAAGVAALELLWVRDVFAARGRFRWALLRADLAGAPAPVRAVADLGFSYRGTVVILGAMVLAAASLPWTAQPAPAWVVVAATLLIAVRFGGSYNGGSDAMLLVVALALALARTAPGTSVARAGLAYAAVQLVLSYFVAGVAKLGDPRWRRGVALPILVRLPHYHVPGWARAQLSRPLIARLAAWSMLAFELGFPLALVDRRAAIGLMIWGAGFHLINALVFGLNRFLWTWLAAYPALLYWAGHG